MDHLLNGNLRAPEDHLQSSSSEIVDDVVTEIAVRVAFSRNKPIFAIGRSRNQL